MRRLILFVALLLPTAVAGPVDANHETNTRRALSELGFHDLGGDGFNTDVWTWTSRDDRLFAAVGTWGVPSGFADPGEECPSETDSESNPSHSGVKIIDATDPGNPQLVARLGTVPGAQNNDIKVHRLPTLDGSMDLLVNSLEPCGAEGLLHQIPGSPAADFASEVLGAFDQDVTGFQVWDVDDPAAPVRLGKYENGGLGTHNLYPYEKDGRSYVAAVFNSIDFFGAEEEDLIEGFLDIVDITDPEDPQRVSRWRLEDAVDQGGPPEDDVVDDQGNVTTRGLCQERGTDSANCYNHDVWVSDDGTTAYLSFWDAGLILLDISDPAMPRFIGQGQEQLQAADPEGWLNEEGNTHVAVPIQVGARQLVMVGDEDFTGGAELGVTVNSPADVAGFNLAVQWAGTPEADGGTADFVYVGAGCTPLDYSLAGGPTAVSGKIVFADHRDAAPPFPDCTQPYLFGQKVNLAAQNGAIGFVQYPGEGGEPTANATAFNAPIPALEVFDTPSTRAARQAVLANSPIVTPGNTAPPVNATLGRNPAQIDPWGFMRIVDVTSPDPANWREIAQFKAPHVDDPSHQPADVFTAHNPLIGPDGRVYFAWYTDGLRVLEPGGQANPGAFREVGWFVPRPDDHPDDNDQDPRGAQEDNFGFWGSQAILHPVTGQMLVFNTDLNRGLYILGSSLPATFGGPGRDVRCPRGFPGREIIGTNGRDILVGTQGRDTLCGGRKNDTLRGRGGKDLLIGGNGKDDLRGGAGNDTLRGGPGNDILAGGAGKDTLRGGGGRDLLRGGAKKDRCVGGGGKDRVRAC